MIAVVCVLCGLLGYRYGFRSESRGMVSDGEAGSSARAAAVRGGGAGAVVEAGTTGGGSYETLGIDGVLAALDEAASERDREVRDRLYVALFARLAALDREAALQRYLMLGLGEGRRSAVEGLATGLAEIDPAGALAFWLSSGDRLHEDDRDFYDGMYHLFKVWQGRDPQAAVAALDELEEDRHRMSAINGFFSTGDFEDAAHRDEMLALASSLTTDGDRLRSFRRKHAMGLVVRGYAEGKSLEFMDAWLGQQELEEGDRSFLDWMAAESQLAEDPHGAVEWLLGRSTEKALPGHLANIVDRWARRQPNACGEWLGSLEVGEAADLAIARFAEIIVDDDRESAVEWAGRIADDGRREKALERLKR